MMATKAIRHVSFLDTPLRHNLTLEVCDIKFVLRGYLLQ